MTPNDLAAAIGYYRAMFDPARHDPAYDEAQAAVGRRCPRSPPSTSTAPTTAAWALDAIGDVRSRAWRRARSS